ncbi:MAG: glutamate--tRNA ligase, partial [Calditrichia bacterium]
MSTGNTENIRTRFAPSPTGFLHVGGARTALFNWIYARRHGGKFLLRVEDTDRVRSTPENTRKIFDDLIWLGINWDEEVIYQSTRSDIYRQYANLLLETDKAYRCFCTAETLAKKRHLAEQNKLPYLYDKTCRRLAPEVVSQNLRENKPFTLRLRVPEGETAWRDLIRENIRVANSEIDDFIILRSDGTPIYQLAVVVDDHFMEITHVIRGDDHISNTPKQILLYNAFGWDIPLFGHIPLILGADKKRLSKRHGATSVGEFRERGYLADALKNYLVLLGWSPGDDREIMSMDEIIKRFSLENIQKKSAIFDEAKLQWFNALYIRNLP